ncbi:uncharacterized protein LOC135378565 [Ornithodoros turicata]|uniref:uncharacterized protein LOC135378565 n=1 Tax=Ornithodoros turicata TaxID=34597 RepID=UPI00313A0607
MAGFRPGRSALDCVINLVSRVQQVKAEGLLTAAVFLDVKKAYDSVYHAAILDALTAAQVGGCPLRWIQDFLSGRYLFVRTAGGDTTKHHVTRGVPQGSVLSHILFNLIMASLTPLIPAHTPITIYADDIRIWTSATRQDTIQRRLQSSLHVITTYLASRGLTVSPAKTVAMAFSRKCFRRWLPQRRLPQFTSSDVSLVRPGARPALIFIASIRPSCWGHYATASLYCMPLSQTQERELLNIQARGLRICLGVPRTSETYGTLAEARETPVPLLRDADTLRVYSRYLTSHPHHYLCHIDDECPDSAFGKTIARLKDHLPSSSTTPNYAPAMWTLARPDIFSTIPGLQRKRDTPAPVALQLALHFLHSTYQNHRQVYTDGSVTADSSGAAFYIPDSDFQHAYVLPYPMSSMEADLLGILSALQHLLGLPAAQWVVLTDSKASLDLLLSFRPSAICTLNTLILQALTQLAATGHSVTLQWIPGHVGLLGNTRADTIARNATSNRALPATPLPLTISVCSLHIRRWRCVRTRQFRADSTSYHHFVRLIDPMQDFTIACRCNRAEESLLHRLRMNVALLYKMRQTNTLNCTTCCVEADTEHYLLSCNRYLSERLVLQRHLRQLGYPNVTLATVLGPVLQN